MTAVPTPEVSNELAAPHGALGGSVTLDRVTLGYGGQPVVDNVSGVIGRGTLLALVGPNGAGKSTLLKALAGLHEPMSGTIEGMPDHRAYLAQHTAIDPAFPISVVQFVTMGLWREIGFWRPVSRAQHEMARAALARVGLEGVEGRRIGALSGGQLRRALFARTMLQDAQVILLDEPFASIDMATATDLLGVIAAWHAEGRTVIAALHDLDQARTHFPATLLMARSVIAWGDSRNVLSEPNLAAARAASGSRAFEQPATRLYLAHV